MKQFLSIILFLLLVESVQCNTPKKRDILFAGLFLEKLFYVHGSDFGYSINPYVGFELNKRLQTAATFRYNAHFSKPDQAHNIGVGALMEYAFVKNINRSFPIDILAHANYEYFILDKYRTYSSKEYQHLLWVGPGVRQRLGVRSAITLYVMWNLNERYIRNPTSPTFRFSLTF